MRYGVTFPDIPGVAAWVRQGTKLSKTPKKRLRDYTGEADKAGETTIVPIAIEAVEITDGQFTRFQPDDSLVGP